MTFVILGFDGPDGQAKRKIHRTAHLAGLEPLNRAGRVLLAGPFTDQAGSLIIISIILSALGTVWTQYDYKVLDLFYRTAVNHGRGPAPSPSLTVEEHRQAHVFCYAFGYDPSRLELN